MIFLRRFRHMFLQTYFITDLVPMRKKVVAVFLLLSLLFPLSIVAQSITPAKAIVLLKEERDDFLQYFDYISYDSTLESNFLYKLRGYIELEADSISQSILSDSALDEGEKAKAIMSMVYFFRELGLDLPLRQIELPDIPVALSSYRQILKALLFRTSFTEVLIPLDPWITQVLAATFWQFDECDVLDDISTYKRAASSPAHILQFLERDPGFRFADSLLTIGVAYDPLKAFSWLSQARPGLQKILLNHKNIYIQQIVSLLNERNTSELIPFIVPLAEKKITPDEILDKRADISSYFQLLVNTLNNSLGGSDKSAFIFHNATRIAIKEKALLFYVNKINELHSAPDAIRFAAVKDLRIEDLYYIITSCEEELYTSSYLGLYRRLMTHFRIHTADSIFRLAQYDNFRVFMRMAASYNTLADFLSCMPHDNAANLLKRFISGIESDRQTGLEKAMDIADSFAGLGSLNGLSHGVEYELQANLERCRAGELYFGMRLYRILLQVYELLQQKTPDEKLWNYLGNHEKLERKSLLNKQGEIIEQVLFYGDEDGVSSFHNFLALFKDPKQWAVSANDLWITIRSLSGQGIVIYANRPLDTKTGMDLQAQDSLSLFFHRQSLEPVIIVHRGHSYHLTNTLKRIQPSVRLAILGSCGGYNSIVKVADISPASQIIVSKKIGSRFINDPMIDVINNTLLNNKDITWTKVWEELRIRLSNDKMALTIFDEYIPPTKNVSLFVLKLFNLKRLQF
jgi:hypothetical protein